ncbi:MAG: UDP-N-acetylmuramate-alanine ligase [Bacteroidetes bacterium]|jgi:UDP-N-acetylmuramate: L-alanyl-gamma-D-glutamyl-meso-diaminopimelate ligase|nr:UDP-N-acetylmuramate-alanine ligase [Bacteroidota bacterium]
MKVHLIAIGGSAMHNMAIAMHKKGYKVTGSDDEIFEPSKTRLADLGLLPAKEGWDVNNIHSGLDAIILGMHARADNPELLKAQELGLKIYSYPEYIYEQTRDKIRVVVGGSHGKTTITAMILHVLNHHKIDCDYMVGAQLAGFDTMVKLTKDAKIAVIEGDEYLSSPIDRRPKFHLYKPNVAILSGIAWDHINVFPTFDNYVEQFSIFADLIEPNGSLVYCELDPEVKKVCEHARADIKKFPYAVPANSIKEGITVLTDTSVGNTELEIFGDHNLMNLNGARIVCIQIGVSDEQFYSAIKSFKGASKRLELVNKNSKTAIYKDFAHSPSKLKATTQAVKKQFPDRKLIACMELHTFSSLNENFLKEYEGSMELADEAIVYFNPHTIEHKKLKPITEEQVKNAFGGKNISVCTSSKQLLNDLLKMNFENKNLLMMSSGNFDGIDFKELGKAIAG